MLSKEVVCAIGQTRVLGRPVIECNVQSLSVMQSLSAIGQCNQTSVIRPVIVQSVRPMCLGDQSLIVMTSH